MFSWLTDIKLRLKTLPLKELRESSLDREIRIGGEYVVDNTLSFQNITP